MFRVFRYVYVSTLCLIAALGFERAWSHELPPYYLDPDVSAQFRSGAVQFRPCAENLDLECARLTLPVDYGKPHGETFSMGVIRAPATKPARRIGVLMQNPGDPGKSGVDFVLESARTAVFERLRERFDIVSFDPRGVARSREVSSLSTNNVARDVDALRRALGEKQITVVGPSYGGRIGAVYASLFPQHVRAMVLDGALLPEHRDNLVESPSQVAIAQEMALRRLDTVCREDAECPLRDTGVIAALESVTARLEARPIVTPDGRLLNDTIVKTEIGKLLRLEPEWPRIVRLLAAALKHDFAPLLAAARAPDAPLLARDNIIDATELPVIRDVSKRVDHPILIIGVDFDSASPLSWSRSLARALGMEDSFIRYQGSGHTAFPAANSICIDLAVEAYLFDLAVPAAGTRCPAQPIHF